MKKNTILLLITLVVFLSNSCKTESKKQQKENQAAQIVPVSMSFEGNYVSETYSKRNEGYDWMAVSVSKESDHQLKIIVRSRADKKKPTCTFDIIAQKFDEATFTSFVGDKKILFRFKDNGITIGTEQEQDKDILNFYCSGGASFAGTFTKINEPLDEKQIDKTLFSKVLNLQNVGFNISSIYKNGKTQLTVFTFGLTNDFNETMNIQNEIVISAEVDDLDRDGSPELVVFTKDSLSNSKANLHAFSVNNKRSMSAVFFEPTVDNQKMNTGYNGQAEFTLMEGNLVQRFPVFENNVKTNKVRQIQYKLQHGEASKKFVAMKQTEYVQ